LFLLINPQVALRAFYRIPVHYQAGALGVSPRKFMKLIENDKNIAINDYNHY
jgi:hypothetical protein